MSAVGSGAVASPPSSLIKSALLPYSWEVVRELRPSQGLISGSPENGTVHLWVWEHLLLKNIVDSTDLCLSIQTKSEGKRKGNI